LPVSTTHSIVGAIAGFGLIYGGFACLNWGKLFSIVMSWVVSPVSGGLIAFLVFRYINHSVFKSDAPAVSAQKVAPRLIFPVVIILVLAVIYKGLKNLHLDLSFIHALGIAAGLGLVVSGVSSIWLKRAWKGCGDLEYSEQIQKVEQIFRIFQLWTASYVAFAHGANDVANAVGPLAGIYTAIKMQAVQAKVAVPMWILAIGAVGIVIGLATWGYRVIYTVGKKITEITPTRGFSAELACATTVLVCSRLGLPISTTHTLVGSVIGVSLARGLATLDRKVVLNIVYSWVITIPAAAILTILLFQVISRL
jgi:PiT family inorganic phosphate transporter